MYLSRLEINDNPLYTNLRRIVSRVRGASAETVMGSVHLLNCSPQATIEAVIEIRETDTFSEWLKALKDTRAKARIAARTQRLAFGNPGDVRPVGEGVSELRIDYGPGYRVYYMQRGRC
jgi:putative addiction module killer protein